MGAVTPTIEAGTSKVVKDQKDVNEVKVLFIETANTADASDYYTFDLATVGGTTLLALIGTKHTTDNSVMVVENPTTTVSGTTITFTAPAGTDNDKRTAIVYYK
jgi:hypothetical protein